MNSDDISKIAYAYTHHDLIVAHTELPPFPKLRIDLLQTFMKHGAFKLQEQNVLHELYALAVSLVQMGLETHDMIAADNDPSDEHTMRSIQFKVLAGDYFSARFYQLLAKQGQIQFIKHIADAISELNSLKMSFYMNIKQLTMTAEEYLQQATFIKMQLFLPFTAMMKDSFAERWSSLLHSATKCEVIAEQIERNDEGANDPFQWHYWYNQKNNKLANIKLTLIAMLEKQLDLLYSEIEQVDNEHMVKQLSRIGESFASYLQAPQIGQEI